MRLFRNSLQHGMLVRYGNGETALARLTRPHAGGWHGKQCMGGVIFMSEFYAPSEEDFKTWQRCDKWRKNEGYSRLSFATLRKANLERANTTEKYAVCKTWTLDQWFKAVVGELGEFANISKKVDRGDFTLEEAKQSLAKEIADTLIYLDLMAHNLDIDLGSATIEKFNEVSQRVGSNIYLDDEY